MKRTYQAVASLSLLVLAVGASATRNRADRPDNGRVVTFDVAVADKNGNPVVGLERQERLRPATR